MLSRMPWEGVKVGKEKRDCTVFHCHSTSRTWRILQEEGGTHTKAQGKAKARKDQIQHMDSGFSFPENLTVSLDLEWNQKPSFPFGESTGNRACVCVGGEGDPSTPRR